MLNPGSFAYALRYGDTLATLGAPTAPLRPPMFFLLLWMRSRRNNSFGTRQNCGFQIDTARPGG